MEAHYKNTAKNFFKIRKVLFYFFFFLLFFIPFQFSLGSFLGFDFHLIRLFSLIIFIFWLFIISAEKKIIIPTGTIFIFFILFIFFSFLSLFFAINPDWGIRKAIFLLSFLPFLLIPASILTRKKHVYLLLKALTWGAFISAIVGIIQFSLQFFYSTGTVYRLWSSLFAPFFLGKNFSEAVLDNSSWLVNISGQTIFRLISFFPDPHIASFYFGMSIPLSLALYWNYKSKIYLFSSFSLILANFLTFSRGGYLAMIIATIIAGIFFMNKINKKIVSVKAFLLALFLIIFTLSVLFFSPIGGRLASSFDLNEGSNAERLDIWRQSLEISLEKPLVFGLGLGNFPLKIDPLANYRDPIYSHNLYLDILAEIGYFGLFCFISLLLFSILNLLKKASLDIFYYFPIFSILIFSVHSLFDTSLFSVHIFPFLLVLFAISDLKLKHEDC